MPTETGPEDRVCVKGQMLIRKGLRMQNTALYVHRKLRVRSPLHRGWEGGARIKSALCQGVCLSFLNVYLMRVCLFLITFVY